MKFIDAPMAMGQAVASLKIHGTVTDTTGAVVPGATIVATQIESGASGTAVSNEAGSYLLTNLPVGGYTVRTIRQPA
jgi:hypothetical protein